MPIFDGMVQMKGIHRYSLFLLFFPSLGRVLQPKSQWTRLAGSSVPSCAEQLGTLRVCKTQEALPRMQTKDMSVKASFVNYISYSSLGEFKGGKKDSIHPTAFSASSNVVISLLRTITMHLYLFISQSWWTGLGIPKVPKTFTVS